MKKYIYLIAGVLLTLVSYAQQDTLEPAPEQWKKHIVGFDANTMLSQVVPFNAFRTNSAFPSIVSRRLFGNRGYRFAAGLDVDFNNEQINNAYISIGSTRKQKLNKRLYWVKGFDARFYATDNFNTGFIGIAPYWGVEYQVNDIFSLSSETSLEIGLEPNFGELAIQLRPPVHIQCHFFINKK